MKLEQKTKQAGKVFRPGYKPQLLWREWRGLGKKSLGYRAVLRKSQPGRQWAQSRVACQRGLPSGRKDCTLPLLEAAWVWMLKQIQRFSPRGCPQTTLLTSDSLLKGIGAGTLWLPPSCFRKKVLRGGKNVERECLGITVKTLSCAYVNK